MGYPDMGAGFFSRELEYKDWYRFNVHQRIHGNSIEHLSWFLPLLMVQGAFMPRFATAMASMMLVGREFYRFGYLNKDGPSSIVREMGAVPLNAAGFLLIGSFAFLAAKRRTGDFFSRRKSVRYFTHNHLNLRLEKVLKDAELDKLSTRKLADVMHPMHPKIMAQMEEVRSKERGDALTP